MVQNKQGEAHESGKPVNEPLYVVGLHLENCKRITAVHIIPDSLVTVLEGKNRQGKSSVIDGLAMAIGGGKQIPDVPIRTGATEMRARVGLGPVIGESPTLEIFLSIAQKRKTLIVKDKEGMTVRPAQGVLDRFYNDFTFDPVAFKDMPAKKQLEALNKVLGLDFTEHNKTHTQLYERRRVNNGKLAQLAVGVSQIVAKPDQYPEFIEVSQLAEAHEANELLKAKRDRALAAQAFAAKEAARLQSERGPAVKRLQDDLDAAVKRWQEVLDSAALDLVSKTEELESCVAPDENTNLAEQIEHATTANKAIADYVTFTDKKKAWEACLAESETMTTQLTALDDAKAKARADAPFPVEGMGVTDDYITLQGLPFDQASTEEQFTACFKLGMAANPTLRFMACRNASMLDNESLDTLKKVAKEVKAQLLLEIVANEPSGNAIFIEDGAVLEPAVETAGDDAKAKAEEAGA